MIVEFLERYRASDGRRFGIGDLADLPEGEARVLIRTGRAKEFRIRQESTDPPNSDE